jgi:UrcA family protein
VTGLAFGAAVSGDPPQRTVSYADLDLSHKAGAETLLARITAAAHDVCKPQLSRVLATGPDYQRCVNEAIGRAIADVNAPVLAVLYRAGSAR